LSDGGEGGRGGLRDRRVQEVVQAAITDQLDERLGGCGVVEGAVQRVIVAVRDVGVFSP
jgi:hypothetical protein